MKRGDVCGNFLRDIKNLVWRREGRLGSGLGLVSSMEEIIQNSSAAAVSIHALGVGTFYRRRAKANGDWLLGQSDVRIFLLFVRLSDEYNRPYFNGLWLCDC